LLTRYKYACIVPVMVDSRECALEALEKAVAHCGGQAPLARQIGVKQAHIWNWLNKSRRVPAEHAIAVEEATAGAVTRYQLRPDVFGPAEPSGLVSQNVATR